MRTSAGANWNVIGLILDTPRRAKHAVAQRLSRCAGQRRVKDNLVERYVYTPYGELTVYQERGYGDYDGDGDVDSTDRAAIEAGGDCLGGSPPAACAILDFDFDADWDSDDRDAFDSLPQGLSRHPGRVATNVSQPFAHQGLLFEPEIGSYQNRARQYGPGKRRFMQRDPLHLRVPLQASRMNTYGYLSSNSPTYVDPSGLEIMCWSPEAYVQCLEPYLEYREE